MQNLQESKSFNCNICKDEGIITSVKVKRNIEYETSKPCKCQKIKEIKVAKDKSGMGDLIKNKTFDNYVATKDYQKFIKQKALDYVEEMKSGNRVSVAILGQSGIGKTHILSAVTQELLEVGIGVRYYIADDIIQILDACKYDEENYNREFNKIANSPVLFIDDLFKTSITNYYNKESINRSDLRVMFKIINYRSFKNLPVMVSSEIQFDRLSKLDQAVAGRINEMCQNKYVISVKEDPMKNYRLIR